MLRVALDASPLQAPTGGIRRYVEELLAALRQEYPQDRYLLLPNQPRPSWIDRRWWLLGVNRAIEQNQVDLFHGTDFSVPYRPIRPAVMTVHDLSPWRYPKETSPRVRWRTPWLLRLNRATHVITPSQAIRRELLARFRFLKPDRVTAIPLAAPSWMRPVPRTPHPPYFLFAGTANARKGLSRLIECWRGLPAELWIAGRHPAGAAPLAPEPGLRILGQVPDAALPGLYSNALAAVYPSEYEGFGLPVVEAMQCGAPVITSADPALMETGGDAALISSNWREALKHALNTPEWRAEYSARSLARAAAFSWRGTARLTRSVYEDAVGAARAGRTS